MKYLVQIAFAFVVGLWMSEGQVAEVPFVYEETTVAKPGANSLLSEQKGRTCSYSCLRSVSYVRPRFTWCWFGQCSELSTDYRLAMSICSKCCNGWTGTPGKCTDYNECLEDNPCHSSAFCRNTPGSYECGCKRGYRMIEGKCVDINECAMRPCLPSGTCYNTPGSYKCVCKTGYQANGRRCIDINECANNPCSSNSRCLNTQGSYLCICDRGFQMENNKCVDINECSWEPSPCPSNASCHNTPGSYNCDCKSGYKVDETTKKCVDIDECQMRGICNQTCTNTPGSYVCSCSEGYQIFMNRYCVDIDECRCNNGGCPLPLKCVNTPGSNYCDCPDGLTLKGNLCHLKPSAKLNSTLSGNKTVLRNVKLPATKTTLTPHGSS